MDAMSASSRVTDIWVMKSSQVGVTEATVNFLGYVAGLAAAYEPVCDDEYRRASVLAAINLHVEDSVFDRPQK